MPDREEVSSRTRQDGAHSVSEWRLSEVEKDLRDLNTKYEGLDAKFIHNTTLDLMLEPWKQQVRDIVAERKSEIHLKSQLKIAIAVAFVSPILSAIVAYVLRAG